MQRDVSLERAMQAEEDRSPFPVPMADERSDPGSPRFSAAFYPFAYVTRVSSRYNAHLTRALRRIGLDQPSWRVLMILVEQRSASIGELVDRTAVKQPTLTRILQRMRRNHLVVTTARVSDQRIVDVVITEEGRQAVERSRPLASATFRRGIAGLSDAEVGELIRLMKRIETNYVDR